MLFFLKDEIWGIHEAILLAVSPNQMRLAVRNFPDTVELTYQFDEWRTEEGRAIEIESVIAEGQLDSDFCFSCMPRTRAAG